MRTTVSWIAVAMVICCDVSWSQVPEKLSYQGRVTVNGASFTGLGQFKFALINSAPPLQSHWSNDGTSVAGGAPASAVTIGVTGGVFNVLLGDTSLPNMTVPIPVSAFANPSLRLRIWFNDGLNGWRQLSPDQELASVGYAIRARDVADSAITSAKLVDGSVTLPKLAYSGIAIQAGNGLSGGGVAVLGGSTSLSVNLRHDSSLLGDGGANDLRLNLANPNTWTGLQSFSGGMKGDGAGLTGVDAATLEGYGASSLSYWKLSGNSGTRAGLNYVGTTDDEPLELRVSGSRALRLEPTGHGPNLIGGDASNRVRPGATGATVGGGAGHFVGGNYGMIGGGQDNSIATNAAYSAICGGRENAICWQTYGSPPGPVTNSSIHGGFFNQVYVANSVIGGGVSNSVGGDRSNPRETGHTISGGQGNYIDYEIYHATIGGGRNNAVSGTSATIAGGEGNHVRWIGPSSGNAIGGGVDNHIASYDSSTISGGFSNQISGSFAAIPGGRLNRAVDYCFAAGNRAKATNEGAFVWADSVSADFFSTANNQVSFRCNGGARFLNSSGIGLVWTPGTTGWTYTSDRAVKEGVVEVNTQELLSRLSRLPIKQWRYKGYDQEHIGPMAQDFHALFPLNQDEKTLSSSDLEGVSLAAIQALHQTVQQQQAQISDLRKELLELRRTVNKSTKPETAPPIPEKD